jgi:hypothetical protein
MISPDYQKKAEQLAEKALDSCNDTDDVMSLMKVCAVALLKLSMTKDKCPECGDWEDPDDKCSICEALARLNTDEVED